MKHTILTVALLGLLVSACASPTNVSSAVAPEASGPASIESSPTLVTSPGGTLPPDEGDPSMGESLPNATPAPASPGSLSSDEADALRYMREEEKLAHDVYLVLYEQWQLPVFRNIARSEQTHTDAVATLLDRYELEDPATADVGTFTDKALQSLYDRLVAQGSRSPVDALRVGAWIEEIDILDLEQRIAQTDNPDILRVYENLTNGSRNHLRAFVSTVETRTGETYQPQYLSWDAYQAIVAGSVARGGRVGRAGAGGARYGHP